MGIKITLSNASKDEIYTTGKTMQIHCRVLEGASGLSSPPWKGPLLFLGAFYLSL
jgi:hypothetical protein